MEKKRSDVITASRAEFGLLELILKEIYSSSKLDIILYVSGMHILPKYGNTIELVRNAFENVSIIE